MELLNRIGENAKAASRTLAGLSGAVRDRGLEMLAQGLLDACEDILAANPSIANQTIFMNAVTGGFDDVTNLSIPAKSLSVAYNTIANPNLWSSLYIIVLPIGILAAGLIFWARRRKR